VRSIENRSKGFSLIELLVVISVVAILAALTWAGIGAAIETSRSAKCISNLRAIGSASLTYFNDNNSEFFPRKHWDTYPSWGPEFQRGMRDYLGVESEILNIANYGDYKMDSVLTCPTMRSLHPNITLTLHRTYSMNLFLLAKHPERVREDLANGPRRLSNVRKPSSMWTFTDGLARPEAGNYQTTINNRAHVEELDFPHRGRQNVVFLDGHVESLTREEFLERAESNDFWGSLD
jgi:prepilin-type N-terminal cleavage/methylation domain-containing protein/prepilin-type processing-associated H-X9-DG protein